MDMPASRHTGKTFKGHDQAKIMVTIVDYLNSMPDHEVRGMFHSVNPWGMGDPYQVMVLLERRAG